MIQKIVTKEELYKLLNYLLQDFEVIGPKELANRGIFYETIKNPQDLYLGEGFTTEPVKKFFLNPSEWLFKCQYNVSKNSLEEITLTKTKWIIFGVRPCEARGLELLDKVYNSEYKDESYVNNRNRTVIIGLSCAKPGRACFCTSMGGSNVESRGMDAILFATEGSPERSRGDKDGKFILEIITDKGKEILGSIGNEPSEEEKKHWQQDREKRKDLVRTKIKATEELDKIFENPYWEQVSKSCLSCGICTYLCPTCHCFDLVDEQRRRLRCYDGCAFVDFTLQASGENHRPTKKERYRQRVFHKFNYFKKNFGENLCVGCGRCIRYCPVKMDIADIVDKAPV
ncbi:MAG: 4Fe-4S dicluster domain-containing protein [Candidatus Omnitrophota bacterium]|nr:4Fe-4S dicluster domain-containing protein [Candidatus Omnitrophota bacterium]